METKCVDAWSSLETNCEGEVKLCCMSKNNLFPKKHVGVVSLDSYVNSPVLKEIREYMLAGKWHPNCKLCKIEEEAGRSSKRIRDNEQFKGYDEIGKKLNQPIILDLKLGTKCNISCRTCGYFNSSGWVKENMFFADDYTKKTISKFQEQVDLAYSEDNANLWDVFDKWLPNLKHIDMYGGEPMLIKKQWEIIKKSADLGYSKNQSIHYNTNGTIFKPEYMDILKKYKLVDIQFSIDGIFNMFEYLRYPAKWNRVYANMIKYKEMAGDADNIKYNVCITISIYNIYYLDVIVDFVVNKLGFNVWLNLVHNPEYFSIINVPDQVKPIVVNKLEKNYNKKLIRQLKPILHLMKSTPCDNDVFNKFKKVTAQHDLYRNQSFEKTFPEFAELIKGN